MSRLTILAFLLFSVLNVANALDDRLPVCAAEQYDQIPDIGTRLPELRARLRTEGTEEDFLRALEDMLILRDEFWSKAELCEPNMQIGELLSNVLADVAAVNSIDSLGISQDDSPRWLALKRMDAEAGAYAQSLIMDLIASGFGTEDGGGSATGIDEFPSTCSETQRQRLVNVTIVDYIGILRAALAVDTVGDLLQYDRDQLEFRDGVFADLPRCAEAFEIALQILHLTNDFISAHALAFSGLPSASNPFLQRVEEQFNNLPDWLVPTLNGEPANLSDSFATNLPACSKAQFSELLSIRHPLFDSDGGLSRRALAITSEDDLLAFAQQEIAWRQENLHGFPACAESIAVALHMSQSASDIVAAKSLALDGVDDSDNPYQSILLRSAAEVETYLKKARAKSEAGDAEARETPLAECSVGQVLRVGEYVYAPIINLISPLQSDIRSVRGADYANTMKAWRQSILPNVPVCQDALRLVLLASQLVGGFTAGITLAGIDAYLDTNPYQEESQQLAYEMVEHWTKMEQTLKSSLD